MSTRTTHGTDLQASWLTCHTCVPDLQLGNQKGYSPEFQHTPGEVLARLDTRNGVQHGISTSIVHSQGCCLHQC